MYFKDVHTELMESMMSAVNKKAKRCPNCKKAYLKKNAVISHYIDCAVAKFVGGCCFGVGAAVPAPDYHFHCPICKSVYLLVDGKFVPIVKRNES